MVENHPPTRKEVLSEIASDVGNKLKQAGVGFIAMTSVLSIAPYVIPTSIRKKRDVMDSGEKFQCSEAEKIGSSLGGLGGIASYIAQAEGYSYAVEHDHPEVLLIPVAMNVASSVYEIGRNFYNHTKQKMIDKHNAEGLKSMLR